MSLGTLENSAIQKLFIIIIIIYFDCSKETRTSHFEYQWSEHLLFFCFYCVVIVFHCCCFYHFFLPLSLMFFLLLSIVFCFVFLYCKLITLFTLFLHCSPRYNHPGWLGVELEEPNYWLFLKLCVSGKSPYRFDYFHFCMIYIFMVYELRGLCGVP